MEGCVVPKMLAHRFGGATKKQPRIIFCWMAPILVTQGATEPVPFFGSEKDRLEKTNQTSPGLERVTSIVLQCSPWRLWRLDELSFFFIFSRWSLQHITTLQKECCDLCLSLYLCIYLPLYLSTYLSFFPSVSAKALKTNVPHSAGTTSTHVRWSGQLGPSSCLAELQGILGTSHPISPPQTSLETWLENVGKRAWKNP